ncbi:MAG: superoxide dismutase, Ni [Candidatus Limnocylindria bacterium]
MLSRLLRPAVIARAHCDLPCGVYDPDQARVEAESVYRIIEKYHESDDALFKTRAIAIKERQAELAKRHIEVLWSDYFKPENLTADPAIAELCWKAAKQCSKVKQSLDIEEARTLLDLIDRIGDAWYEAGGARETRLPKTTASARA